MTNKLYIYGCSFGKYGTTSGPDSHQWSDTNSFGDILSKKFNLELVNRSWPGGSNFHIFRKVMQDVVSNNINSEDLVIIQYSFIDRAWCNDLSKTVMPQYEEFQEYYEKYYFDQMALATLVSLNEYLKTKLKCKFAYSTIDNLNFLEKINSVMYQDFVNHKQFFSINALSPIEYLQSLNDINLFLPCNHLSVKGHSLIAELYYNFITNN